MSTHAVEVIKLETHRLIAVLRGYGGSHEARFSREVPHELESPMLRAFKQLYRGLQAATSP